MAALPLMYFYPCTEFECCSYKFTPREFKLSGKKVHNHADVFSIMFIVVDIRTYNFPSCQNRRQKLELLTPWMLTYLSDPREGKEGRQEY